MRIVIALLFVLVPLAASAQPAGSAAPAPDAIMPQVPEEPVPAPPPTPPAAPSAADLRKTCADAMNADPTFADAIVIATLKDPKWSWERITAVEPPEGEQTANELLSRKVNEDTLRKHATAADAIEKNEKHVVLAYAAFWVLAALFVVFLWRRQQGLKAEIAQLKRDLDAASK